MKTWIAKILVCWLIGVSSAYAQAAASFSSVSSTPTTDPLLVQYRVGMEAVHDAYESTYGHCNTVGVDDISDLAFVDAQLADYVGQPSASSVVPAGTSSLLPDICSKNRESGDPASVAQLQKDASDVGPCIQNEIQGFQNRLQLDSKDLKQAQGQNKTLDQNNISCEQSAIQTLTAAKASAASAASAMTSYLASKGNSAVNSTQFETDLSAPLASASASQAISVSNYAPSGYDSSYSSYTPSAPPQSSNVSIYNTTTGQTLTGTVVPNNPSSDAAYFGIQDVDASDGSVYSCTGGDCQCVGGNCSSSSSANQ